MSRRHGKNIRVFMNLTSGGLAEPIAFVRSLSANFTTDKVEVTASGDVNKVYVAGLPDGAGSFEFWYDDATVQTYTAAVDGISRKMYLYPDFVNTPTQYWYGYILPDFNISATIDGGVEGTASWNAAGAILKAG